MVLVLARRSQGDNRKEKGTISQLTLLLKITEIDYQFYHDNSDWILNNAIWFFIVFFFDIHMSPFADNGL